MIVGRKISVQAATALLAAFAAVVLLAAVPSPAAAEPSYAWATQSGGTGNASAFGVSALADGSSVINGQFSGTAAAAPESKPLSYEQARKLLLDRVIKPGSLRPGDALIAFRLPKPLTAGQRVAPYRGRGPAFRAKGPTWFFWVDDDPKARFEHLNRYVFIDAKTRKVRVIKQQWWPLVAGKAPWYAFNTYWKKANWAFSTEQPLRRTSARSTLTSLARAAGTAECAVIVQGSNDDKGGFAQDANGMGEVLKVTFGLDTRKLNPPNNNKANFENAVHDLAEDGCTNMLVYITSHGAKGIVDMGTGDYSAANLKALMEKYPHVGFKVVIDACKSGSWIEPLGDKPEIIITSTDSKKLSYGDWDEPDDPNPDDTGGEFTSGLIEDLREIPKSAFLLSEVQRCLGQGKPLLVCKLRIAYKSAVFKDLVAKRGYSVPQIWER